MNAATREFLRARVNDSRRTILHTDRLLARIESLKADVKRERSAREKADANARRFHAMLLAERIQRLPTRNTNGSGRNHLDGGRAAGATGGEVCRTASTFS